MDRQWIWLALLMGVAAASAATTSSTTSWRRGGSANETAVESRRSKCASSIRLCRSFPYQFLFVLHYVIDFSSPASQFRIFEKWTF